MITRTGYSKNPSIMAEGIVITFGKEMIEAQGGLKTFLQYFNHCMNNPESWWMHKMKNKPTIEVVDVYIIIFNRLYGRVNFGWFENQKTIGGTATGKDKVIEWPRMCIVGPVERCPFKRELKGFQGFRYCERLW